MKKIIIPLYIAVSCLTFSIELDINKVNNIKTFNLSMANEFSKWKNNFSTSEAEISINKKHSKSISNTAISPDGTLALTISEDQTIKLWDIKTQHVLRTYSVEESYFSSSSNVTFLSNGKSFVAVYENGFSIIDLKSGNKLYSKYLNENSLVYAGNVSIDKKRLIISVINEEPEYCQLLLFDLENYKLLWKSEEGQKFYSSIKFSKDVNYFIAADEYNGLDIWDCKSFTIKKTIPIGNESNGHSFLYTDISHNGKYLIAHIHEYSDSEVYNDSLKIWDSRTGNLLKYIKLYEDTSSISISKDWRFDYYGDEQIIRLLHPDIKIDSSFLERVSFINRDTLSSENRFLVSTWEASIYNIDTGESFKPLFNSNEFYNSSIHDLSYYNNDENLVYITSNGLINFIDLKKGKLIKQIIFENEGHFKIDVSYDNKYLAVSTHNKVYIWDISSGNYKNIGHIEADLELIDSIKFSDNKNILSITDLMQGLIIYDLKTNKLDRMKHQIDQIYDKSDLSYIYNIFNFSSNSEYVIWSSKVNEDEPRWNGQRLRESYVISLIDLKSKKTIWSKEFPDRIIHISFTNNDRDVTINLSSLKFNISIETGQKTIRADDFIKMFLQKGKQKSVLWQTDFRKYRDGNSVEILDIQRANIIKLNYAPDTIRKVKLSTNKKYLIGFTSSGYIQYWDVETGNLIYTIFTDNNGSFLVYTQEGFYSGDIDLVKNNIVVQYGFNAYPLNQFFNIFYRPDLVMEKVRYGVISKNIKIDNYLTPLPSITYEFLDSPRSELMGIKVALRDNGGGAKEIKLYHNNKLVNSKNRGLKIVGNTHTDFYWIELLDGNNKFKILSSADNGMITKPLEFNIPYSKPKIIKPELWIFNVGINIYKNRKYMLNYATNDALSFSKTLSKITKSLFSKINFISILNEEVTKDSLIKEFENVISLAKPEDVFVFFYAGHGIAVQNSENKTEFYFIPHDITQMTDKNQLNSLGISGGEFESLLSMIPPRKQFIVIDACNSGALNSEFGVRGAAEEIALSRLSRSTGSALITASREDQFAQEFEELGHGLLTSVLIEGLEGKAALGTGEITVASLKSYVESTLPLLSKKYSGQEQYPTGFINGNDFPIGINVR